MPKFGRLPRKYGRTLHYSALMAGKTPVTPPASADYLSAMPDDLGAMLNDTLGDCTCAAIGHARQVWTFNALNDLRTTPDNEVEQLYETVGGYVPGDPSTDQGCVEQDVLNYCLKSGAPIAPGAVNKLLAWVEVDVRNLDDVRQGIYEAGGIYIGFNVPAFVENLMNPGSVWDADPNGDNTIVGGHAVFVPKFTQADFGLISWGGKFTMTTAFWAQFVDECYVLADLGWINWSGKTPAGMSVTDLESAMQSL